MSKSVYSLIFSSGILLILIWAALEAITFQDIASYFPLYIALFAIVLIMIDVISQLIKLKNKRNEHKISMHSSKPVLKYILWFIGYLILIFLAGFLLATAIFLFFFLLFESKFRMVIALLSIVLTIIIINIFGWVMDLSWPTGIFGI